MHLLNQDEIQGRIKVILQGVGTGYFFYEEVYKSQMSLRTDLEEKDLVTKYLWQQLNILK